MISVALCQDFVHRSLCLDLLVQPCTHAHMHTCTSAHMHKCPHAHTCPHAHMHMPTCPLSCPHAHRCARPKPLLATQSQPLVRLSCFGGEGSGGRCNLAGARPPTRCNLGGGRCGRAARCALGGARCNPAGRSIRTPSTTTAEVSPLALSYSAGEHTCTHAHAHMHMHMHIPLGTVLFGR